MVSMADSPPRLSIIMPMLNEAAGLAATLQALTPLLARDAQLVLADGGSTDDTVAIAQAFAAAHAATGQAQPPTPCQPHWPVQVIQAPRGRALQMNTGAQHAQGHTLLFLHADTGLPPHADALIAQALADGRHVWGRFDVRITGHHWLLRVIGTGMSLRSRWSGIATGDQGLFMTRAAFEQLGGFAPQPLMEDIALSARLRQLSPPACLRARVHTSGRRWETRGVWRTMLLMWQLRWAYWRGAAPEQLAQRYR
jgi:rSAM/selenodomain-associated transferase 2